MKKNQTIVKEINKMFPASDDKYPICFERDERLIVSGECYFNDELTFEGKKEIFETMVINYYECHIDPRLEAYAEKLNCFWEWENPACIYLCNN